MLTLLPAVDVADGKAVRLLQGEVGSETDYGSPVDAARDWVRAGAEWIHLVDLDAAFGRGSNHELLARIVGEVGIKVELSGGIRDDASLARTLAAGAARVNLGTAALEDPEWTERVIAEHGEKIAVGLDVGGDLWETLERLNAAGCARYVVTDVTRDGTLSGPNTELLTEVCRRSPAPVVASGGIAHLDDLLALRRLVPLGLEGAIVGKALYNGNFTLQEALVVAGDEERREPSQARS